MSKEEEMQASVNLLLEICSLLMSSGANTKRVVDTINRFASALNFESHEMISHKSMVMTLTDKETNKTYTVTAQIPKYKVDLSVVAEISRAGWSAYNKKWSYDRVKERIEKIKQTKKYPAWLEILTVGLAGAGFAKLFGGDFLNMSVAFSATLIGMIISKISVKYHLNTYARTYVSAVFASAAASLGIVFTVGSEPQTALATSVLFLVPGVPLINSFVDLFNNHILNGLVRFMNGFMTVLAIGLGLITSMFIFNIKSLL